MSSRPLKVAHLVSHPIPYFAPLYRELSSRDEIDLTVYFYSDATARPYGDTEFGCTVHYITDGVVGTYVVWGEQTGAWRTTVDFDRLRALLSPLQPLVVLAVNSPITESPPPDLLVRPLASFTAAIMPGERYVLYEVTRTPAADQR